MGREFGGQWKHIWASPVVLVVKNLPANAGDKRDVGLIPGPAEDPLEEGMQPTPVFLPGKSHMNIYDWISSLFTWNYHNFVNQLCTNTK